MLQIPETPSPCSSHQRWL